MREMERRLNRAERLSAMGRLAAGVAHEIRNPLNAISMACQRLQKDNIDQLTGIIRDEVRRLNHIIEEFIGLSRSGTLTLKANDLIALMRQMALLVAEEAASLGIALETEWPESPVMIWIDADKIKQALFNVIKNAMESIPNQGTVTLGVVREGKRWVMVRISDTGIGLTREAIEQIFDPDYTTKEKGLGLGLALAHEIIQAHNGEIRVLSEPGKGTTFEILLPVGGERRKG
jgi:signal transduction histidine kinase